MGRLWILRLATINLTRERQDAASRKTAKFQLQKQHLEPRPAWGVGHWCVLHGPWRGLRERAVVRRSFFLRGPLMKPAKPFKTDDLPPLPIEPALWQAVAAALKLSPQLARVTECVVRGMCDKQIAAALGISESTLRSHFDRVFMRTGARGRMAIMRKVLAVSHEVTQAKR